MPQGEHQLYNVLHPGTSTQQETVSTHYWELHSSEGALLLRYAGGARRCSRPHCTRLGLQASTHITPCVRRPVRDPEGAGHGRRLRRRGPGVKRSLRLSVS